LCCARRPRSHIDEGQTMGGTRGDALQRAADAWALRIQGKTWAQIAAALGYAYAGNAARAVRAFVGRLPAPDPEQARTLWRERMEHLFSIAADDAAEGKPGALRAAVAIAQRAAAMDGLDAPAKMMLTADERQLEALAQTILARSGHAEVLEADVLELEVINPDEDDGDAAMYG
jgi:hypothetical protein